MKKVFLLFSFLFTLIGFSQDTSVNVEDEFVYKFSEVEKKPEFPEGIAGFYKFISKNFKVPEAKISGTVLASFVIEKDGTISNIKVIQDIGHGTKAETTKVLKKCPKWTPGEHNGKKVRVQYEFPVKISFI